MSSSYLEKAAAHELASLLSVYQRLALGFVHSRDPGHLSRLEELHVAMREPSWDLLFSLQAELQAFTKAHLDLVRAGTAAGDSMAKDALEKVIKANTQALDRLLLGTERIWPGLRDRA
jgi:hypothetical protein